MVQVAVVMLLVVVTDTGLQSRALPPDLKVTLPVGEEGPVVAGVTVAVKLTG